MKILQKGYVGNGMSTKTFAAIDVGSFEISMKIFEFSGKNSCRVIEHVRQRIDLGTDTYVSGKIGGEKMDELCRTLQEFSGIMSAYKVENYRAYGTSAIRETENTDIVLDRIEQRTGIHVEVLSNSEQRFLDCKSIAFQGSETFRQIIGEGTIILDIGGGSIQISLFDNDTLIATQNLRLGVLRLQEWLHQMNVGHERREELINEMVDPQLGIFRKMYLKDRVIRSIIVVDDYLSVWIAGKGRESGMPSIVGAEDYEHFMQHIRTHSEQEIARQLNMSIEAAGLTFFSACIMKRLLKLTGAENIWAPGVTLCDGIAYEYAERHKILLCEHDFEKDIVACAMNISKRYMGSRKRAETLKNIALTIFDCICKRSGLGKRERLYMWLAVLLHDCGKYISMMDIGENSYRIIMATEIIGLSHMEREIVASVVRYNHSNFKYYGQMHEEGTHLTKEAYLTVAKLTAILRLANGLDRSHKQKLKGVKASLKDDQLIMKVESMEDITLERSMFDSRADFFKEVFSIQPVIMQKKPI